VAHEDFIKLIERVLEDPEFRQRVEAIKNGTPEEMMGELITIAAHDGLVFTEKEVDELFLLHVSGAADEATCELDMSELELVAGGGGGLQTATMFSHQYLQLQDKQEHGNRQFTMLSNIMKSKHDTARTAINNIR